MGGGWKERLRPAGQKRGSKFEEPGLYFVGSEELFMTPQKGCGNEGCVLSEDVSGSKARKARKRGHQHFLQSFGFPSPFVTLSAAFVSVWLFEL